MAGLYAVFAFCRNIPASEKSLLRRSGLLPGTRHHVACQSSSRRNPLAGALAAVTEPKGPENLASQRGYPTWATPQTWCRSQSTALGLRRTFAEALSLCAA